MTNNEILEIAMRQSAIDDNCTAADYSKTENIIATAGLNAGARRYLSQAANCNLTSYGNNIVATVQHELVACITDYINQYEIEECFETPAILKLIELLKPHDLKLRFMAEYFLPDITRLQPLSCGFETRILHNADFAELYTGEWENALCKDRKQYDVLGVGAYENKKLIGLAACSADCEAMWQIGIDVLAEYRKQGIASCLTSTLAVEILKVGIVPFYCAAWSNIKSVRNAIKSGFRPAWVQLSARPSNFK